MKEIIRLYSQSVDETHVQIGEVSVTAFLRDAESLSSTRSSGSPCVAAN